MKRTVYIIFCILAALLTGCATKSPRFYTLSPAAKQAVTTPATTSISVGPVLIPAAVDRPQIVVRTGPNQVFLNDFERWASPLKEDIARVIADNLVLMLGTPQVTVFPQTASGDASYRVLINIIRFESEPGKEAALDALWKVSSKKEGESYSNRTTIAEPVQGGGYAELVAAHSRALGRLSSEIADQIRKMEGN